MIASSMVDMLEARGQEADTAALQFALFPLVLSLVYQEGGLLGFE